MINYIIQNNTLVAYLYTNFDLSAAVIKLKVHKNTVSYRLSKISELFNVDLKEHTNHYSPILFFVNGRSKTVKFIMIIKIINNNLSI